MHGGYIHSDKENIHNKLTYIHGIAFADKKDNANSKRISQLLAHHCLSMTTYTLLVCERQRESPYLIQYYALVNSNTMMK